MQCALQQQRGRLVGLQTSWRHIPHIGFVSGSVSPGNNHVGAEQIWKVIYNAARKSRKHRMYAYKCKYIYIFRWDTSSALKMMPLTKYQTVDRRNPIQPPINKYHIIFIKRSLNNGRNYLSKLCCWPAGKISEHSTVCQEILFLFGLGPIFHILAIRLGLIIDIVSSKEV